MSIYIKVKDDILDEEVIKIIDLEVVAGMPLGSTVRSIIFSLIGVFVVELITGIVGLYGAFRREKLMLAVVSKKLQKKSRNISIPFIALILSPAFNI